MRWTIRQIVREAQQGTPLHRMVVLYRQTAPYATLLREELRLAGIPAAGPGGISLSDTAVGRTLAGLVQLADGELARDDVMALLTGCPVRTGRNAASDAPGVPAGPFRPARWDVVSRRGGVVKGPAQWKERLERHAREAERAALEGLGQKELSEAQANRLKEEALAARHLAAFLTDLAERVRPPARVAAGWSSADGPAGFWKDTSISLPPLRRWRKRPSIG